MVIALRVWALAEIVHALLRVGAGLIRHAARQRELSYVFDPLEDWIWQTTWLRGVYAGVIWGAILLTAPALVRLLLPPRPGPKPALAWTYAATGTVGVVLLVEAGVYVLFLAANRWGAGPPDYAWRAATDWTLRAAAAAGAALLLLALPRLLPLLRPGRTA